ncbi:autophagy-related protein 2 homolog B-like [Sinocyclocheilus grahami]|uniref:autophagy-related protein 2 homolog B-like n=1 Tax=Sinocyclocheilus grahami TaxID=75366 RepID=UPI0007AC56F1|nr:PREDICTED: autophagy-related protein 2 homolog B-like [Sinocyclocheilus grahami]
MLVHLMPRNNGKVKYKKERSSGMEPMCWSSFMTSSMQLAKECLSQRLTDDQGESLQPLEGLEKFAETIETVLRRVKVTFVDTVLRMEHVPENSKTGIALELRINKMVYCDESVEEGSSVNIHQPTTFAHKNVTLEGAYVFWDEFSESARAGLKSSPTQTETEPKLSPSWNPKIICEPHPQFPEPVSSSTPFEPVQMGCLCGKLELSMVLKQNEAMPGAKLDIDGQFDSLIMLLSPQQVHLLLDMFGVFSSSAVQEWSAIGKDRKSRPMQQEDEYRLHMELNRCLKKDTITGATDQDLFESQTTRTVYSREDVFFSMADMDMSHSLSSLPPLGDPPTVDLDLSVNSNYSTSLGESPSGNVATVWDEFMDVPRQKEKQTNEMPHLSRDCQLTHKLLRQTSHPSKGHCDESRPELVLRLTVGSLCLSVLHIDPLPPPDSSRSHLAPMASEFFRILSVNQLPAGSFLQSRTVFDEACPHDHLRDVRDERAVQEWSAIGKDRKSRPMQQEDEYRLHMELNRCLKKDTITGATDQDLFESQTTRTVYSREDVFFSMADMDMSHSLSSLPPLGDPPTVDLDLSVNSNYSTSLGESPSGNVATVWDEFMDVPRQKEKQTNEMPHLSRDCQLTHKLLRQTSHPSKGHCDESRPELVLRLTVGSLCLSVLHIDPLPPPDSSRSHLAPMASEFFRILSVNQLPAGSFLQSRTVFDEACPHDHLRFIGQGLKVAYEHCQGSSVRTLNTDLSLSQVELLECLYSTDSHTTQSGIQYTELLTFDVSASSDSPPPICLHLLYKLTERRGPQGGQVRLSTIPRRAELQVELGKVRSECDVSIVDRLNSLLQPQKLVTTEMMASHMYTSYNKHVSLHKAFAEVFLDDCRTPAHCHVSVSINAPLLVLVVRFPIPDLRSDQERGPWFKKSLQKELLQLELEDLELKTEFTGGSSSEQTKMELTFKELNGSFQEDKDHPAARFLRVANTMEEDMTSSDCGKFDWPRVVLKVNPMAVRSILERVTAEEEEEDADGHSQEEEEEEEGAAHSLKDVCDFGKPEPSPFSSRRVMYENEEMVIPGDVVEMTEFQEKTISNSRYILELFFPNVQLSLPNKDFYEKLHNRINNDLLLWEPTAPSPVETVENIPYGVGLSVASQLINTYSKDSFSQFRSAGPEEEESGSEEEILQYYTPAELGYRNRRKKRSKMQPKNSQSLFSIVLSVNHGLLALHTQLKQDDNSVLPKKHGEFWMEVKNGTLFGVTQHEGYKDQHYVCFHTSQACIYHKGTVDGDAPQWNVNLPCRTRPHWLEPVMYASESAPERTSPSEGLSLEPHSMLSVAVKISSHNTERNVKEFLTAIGMRGVKLEHRVVPSSLGWYDQIVNFLNVSNEPVLGYTPPSSVSTLHLHLWSCSLDYREINNASKMAPLLPEAEQQILQDLMSDAMEETDSLQSHMLQQNGVNEDHSHDHEPPRSDLFLFPDESGNLGQEPNPTYPTLHSPLISPPAPSLLQDTDDFCILDTPGSRVPEKDEEPVVKKLISETILVREEHFSVPLEGSSSNRGPLHFPVPEIRYLIKEISVVWHLYGGKDFCGGALSSSPARSRGCTPHSSPSQTPVKQMRRGSRAGGGWGRNPDVLMEIQLSKVRFQHEVYPQKAPEAGVLKEQPVSRQVFSVQDLEIRDRLASSMMNKFLYLYSSKEMPRKAHSNMLTVRALHMCPETGQAPQECCLRVSLMPLRLNIDQDALFFLKDFFTSLAAEVELFSPPEQEAFYVSVKKPPAPEISCNFSKYNGAAGQDPAPIISVPTQSPHLVHTCSQDSTAETDTASTSFTDQPIFFREFRFTSEVPIRLDYHGKHMAMEQGTFAGIVIGLTQLNCSELKLRRLCYRQGLLGVDKLFSYAINEWLNDIKKNQLPGLLGGVGPIHSLVQLVQGFRDLVWLPIEQYRKDGRIVRGFQRGTASFGTSTAMAALELTNRMVRTIQAAAETAYDMVSPVPDEKECKKIKRYSHYCLAHQPVDLREGVAKAYSVVKEV